MDHYLQRAVLDPNPPMEITAEEYHRLVEARSILNAAFSLEENYDLLVGNYIELENSALTLATSTMAQRRHEYEDMFELTAEMNRRAVNFLSTARLFVDQIRQRVGACGCDNVLVKTKMNEEYDKSFEYRFMEALRNHVQHSGSAVHGLEFGGKWGPAKTKEVKLFTLSVFTYKRMLQFEETFKKTVMEECPEKVDFLDATRCYLGALSDVHEFARQCVEDTATRARMAFEDAISRYTEFSEGPAIALSAYASTDEDRKNPTAIFLNWDDVRLKLQKRNHNLHQLGKFVIASNDSL